MQVNPASKVDLKRIETTQARRILPSGADVAVFKSSEALNRALAETPDIRPASVDRARSLAASSLYPPTELINGISNLLAKRGE